MQISFEGRVAAITGGASGIGLATAERLGQSGATVVILDHHQTALDEAVAQTKARGYLLDVTDGDAVRQTFGRIETDFGALDILVNAAGMLQRPLPPEQLTEKEWQRTISVHLGGAYACATAAGASMIRRGQGVIINVASVAGLRSARLHAYAPAKAAVISLTENLAAEWGRAGVRVNAVAPGFTRTPALNQATGVGYLDVDRLSESAALGRLVDACDVAAAIAFLASDQARSITGVTLPVDAGFLVAGSWGAYGGLAPRPN